MENISSFGGEISIEGYRLKKELSRTEIFLWRQAERTFKIF